MATASCLALLLLGFMGTCASAPTSARDAQDEKGQARTADAAAAPETGASAELTEWVFDGMAALLEVPEPSGLCYHPGRDTLFIVSDGGIDVPASIFELSLDLEVLAQTPLGVDLEGVCYCPLDGLLYVCDEIDELVHVVEPEGLRHIGTFQVSRFFEGEELLTAGGNGFEGIEFIPGPDGQGGHFLLLNQDDPHCLVRVDPGDIDLTRDAAVAPIRAFHRLAPVNAGELNYDPATRELWVVHSWMNTLVVLDPWSLEELRWEVCPGCAQEAVALDGAGRLWIGFDLGGITRYVRQELQ